MTATEEKKIAKTVVSIRPYVNPTVENMGLEKYDMALHQGATHKEFITCLEEYGNRRHLTGLDEFAPEIEKITDVTKRKSVIRQIRSNVAYIEKVLAANVLNIEEKDPKKFWEDVKIVRRDNYTLWDEIFLEVGNDPVFLDPKAPYDLIKICAIEAGGFTEIAKSLEDARGGSVNYKFYLDKQEETSAARTQFKKSKNKALAVLEDLFNSEPKKLWWIAKNIDGNSVQYKNNTPNDVTYDNMDSFINGLTFEKSVIKASELFVSYANMDLEHLRVRGLVRDAIFFKYILHKPDGNLYYNRTSALLGKNVSDCVEYYKNPGNAGLWEALLADVDKHLNE